MLCAMEYPKPSLTADVVAFRYHGGHLQLLLIQRRNAPFQGAYAFPGGFVEKDEPLEQAARRELEEETSLSGLQLFPIGAFGDPGRDPRGWTATAAYVGLCAPDAYAKAGDDAAALEWFDLQHLPELAFDHAQILEAARQKLRELTQISTAPLSLLPAPFRTAQARHLYNQIWDARIQPTAFKAWLRRREAVKSAGIGRFVANDHLREDWLR